MLEKVLIFIIFLGPLVFFHELGHFLFARLAGVRVEVFSIGFGPKLLKWKKGATQYAISLIPLGGYVKMFGDDPLKADELSEEEKKVAFTHKGKWARFWIVFGGPLANFILAFFIYLSLVSFGETVPQAQFGVISKSSELGKAGFETGDALKAINKTPIMSFDDLGLVDSEVQTVTVERDGEDVVVPFEMRGTEFVELFSKAQSQLKAPVVVDGNGNYLMISLDKGRPYSKLSYEVLLEKNANQVFLWPVTGKFESVEKLEDVSVNKEEMIALPVRGSVEKTLQKNKFFPSDLLVHDVLEESPAKKADIKKSDIIVSLDGKGLNGFVDLRNTLQKLQDRKSVNVGLMRNGEKIEVKLSPEIREVNGQKVSTIGVYSGVVFRPLNMVESRAGSVGAAISSAWYRTQEGMIKTALGFKKLITAEVPLKSIGGPLAIGQVASESFNISLSMFFRLMALISINLGIINLFPIPVLDGGHIVFIFLELVNGGPLSRRKIQVAQQFGMSLLFLLIFVALFNDISRIF